MKKLLIILVLAICGISAKAQGVIYEPFIPGQPRQQTQQSNTQTVRTTAYCTDYYGNLTKLPIKVEIQNRYNIVSIRVVEYYENNGIQGYWYKIPTTPQASECMPQYSHNPLERQFMYKVMIYNDYYYFDLLEFNL